MYAYVLCLNLHILNGPFRCWCFTTFWLGFICVCSGCCHCNIHIHTHTHKQTCKSTWNSHFGLCLQYVYIYVNMSVFLDLFLGNYFNTIQKCFRTAYIHIYNNLPWSRVFTQPVRHSNTVMFTFNIYKYLYNSTFLFHNLHTRYMDACCVCSTFSFNFRSK